MLAQARSRKVEAQSKLEQLQRDIAELSSLSPDTVAAEEEVTQKLQEVGHKHSPRMMHMVSWHKSFCTAA